MLNPIVVAALTDRVQYCVRYGLCRCYDGEVVADCPCHNVEFIALNDTERTIAPSVLEDNPPVVHARPVVPEEAANEGRSG